MIALVFFLRYAYGILFLWVLIEQLGLPIPSIPVLLTTGTVAATHRLHLSYAFTSILLACLIADSLWFFLGQRFGQRVLQLLCRFSFEASTCVRKTEGYFSRRGASTLLVAKFIPGLSTVAAPIAGQSGMPYARFVAFDLAGSILWSGSWVAAGYFFGDMAKRSEQFLQILGHFALLLFVISVLGIMLYRLLKQRRFLANVRAARLDPNQLKKMLEDAEKHGNTPPFIVDLRTPLDYSPDPRVLPGAIRVAPAELQSHADLLPRDRDVVLYCTCPSEETSGKVALQLQKLGIYRVRPLRGGFEMWRDAGYPLQSLVRSEPGLASR
jgi:membrane protein DedA with SNARE-associated domain/rhodanese-related sulfurtransferase